MSVGELETLAALDAETLKKAVEDILIAKSILHRVREKYDEL